jgi:hypothetical protein
VESVEVPKGFVSDLASIPAIFFSVLRPDAEYAYAAIVHDYLYWVQARPREVCDGIFKAAMSDFEVPAWQQQTIYQAVSTFGASAWSENAALKAKGEHRILKEFPPRATITWAEWKRRANVFSD